MTAVIIDGSPITHGRVNLNLDAWLSMTWCWIWFIPREHPLETQGVLLSENLRGRRVDDPIDCMTCLIVKASL